MHLLIRKVDINLPLLRGNKCIVTIWKVEIVKRLSWSTIESSSVYVDVL